MTTVRFWLLLALWVAVAWFDWSRHVIWDNRTFALDRRLQWLEDGQTGRWPGLLPDWYGGPIFGEGRP